MDFRQKARVFVLEGWRMEQEAEHAFREMWNTVGEGEAFPFDEVALQEQRDRSERERIRRDALRRRHPVLACASATLHSSLCLPHLDANARQPPF
jgi:hypothetical protein